MSGPEHRHDDDRTGNGIVNHGPEKTPDTDPGGRGDAGAAAPAEAPAAAGEADGSADESADPAGTSGTGGVSDGGGGTLSELFASRTPGASTAKSTATGRDAGPDADADLASGAGAGSDPDAASDPDGMALRRLLQSAVQDLAPSEGTLDRLHRAVPARRARRRQAVVGAAAAALLIGTAVPAFVHVAGSDGSSTASPAIAGHGEQAQGGSGDKAGTDAGTEKAPGPAAEQNEGSKGEPDSSTAPSQGAGSDPEGEGTGGTADSSASAQADSPACDPSQLRVASAESGAAGADGKVYGTFRIANASGKDCSVTSNGTVGFQTAGAADPLKISVVQHTAGDPAAGLPDPSLEPGTVLLKPAMAYEVKFAWVPTDTCPATGTSPSPTPTDAVGGGSTGSGTTASDGAGTQFAADDGPADGSVAVTHTPESGAPTAETNMIPNACAGTIYRTGVLDAS